MVAEKTEAAGSDPLGPWNVELKALAEAVPVDPDYAKSAWKAVPHADMVDAVDVAARALRCRPSVWRVWVGGKDGAEMTAGCRFLHPELSRPPGFSPVFGVTTTNNDRQRLRVFCGVVENATGRFVVGGRLAGPKYTLGFDPLEFGREAVGWWREHLEYTVNQAVAGMAEAPLSDRDLTDLLLDASRVSAVQHTRAPLFLRRKIGMALDRWAGLPPRRRTVLEACLMASDGAAVGCPTAMWDRAFLFAGLAATVTPEAARAF